MAIVTLDEVKTYLQITDTGQDNLINELIPQAEGLYLQVRGIDFFTFTGDITDTSAEITNIADEDFTYLKTNKIVDYDNESFRSRIITVDEDNNKIVCADDATLTAADSEIIIYPYGAQLTASKIIGYFLSKSSASGYQSENIGNYSYTKYDNNTGLPLDIVNMIEKYQGSW